MWSFDKAMVRVSPLATADSVELGASKAADNTAAAAIASCGAAASRQRALIVTSRPANNPSFYNTARPAAKPADCAFPFHTHTLWPALLPPAPHDPQSAYPFALVVRTSAL